MKCLLLVLALCCIPVFSSEARACQCMEYGTPVCASFWRSDAVFVGRLVNITSLKQKPDNIYKYVALHFVVEEAFRGVSTKRVVVGASTGNLCDSKFLKGSRYLVYASQGTFTKKAAVSRTLPSRSAQRGKDAEYLV